MGNLKDVCSSQISPRVSTSLSKGGIKGRLSCQLTCPNPFDMPSNVLGSVDILVSSSAKIRRVVRFTDFHIEGIIGQGGFGVVYRVRSKDQRQFDIFQHYALKKVSKQFLKTKNMLASATIEKEIQSLSGSNFIVPLIMAFQDSRSIYFLTQLAEGGDTYSLLKEGSAKNKEYLSLGQNAIQFIAGCVILALQFLHKKNFMFRDLKPENVLLFKNGYAKLTDFGLAKRFVEDQVNQTVSGTPIYLSPEMVLKLGYTKNVDLWALGVFIYQLSVLKSPFDCEQRVLSNFKNSCCEAERNRNWRGATLSPQIKNLIDGLLKFNPKERLGADEKWQQIKDHQFFKDFDWKALEEESIESPLKQIVAKYPAQVKPCHLKKQISQETEKMSSENEESISAQPIHPHQKY